VALEHQRSHAGEPCPVCGGRLLDDAWVTSTEASIANLTSQATAAEEVHSEESAAVRALGELVPPKPMVLRADFGGAIDASAAKAAWERWTPPDVSAETFTALSAAVDELRSQALAVLRRLREMRKAAHLSGAGRTQITPPGCRTVRSTPHADASQSSRVSAVALLWSALAS
jgi:hypothetical protein